ncbi:hypothetical protein ACFYPK_01780 [Streptomyces halstedii]|uniref:hypothetical protein n=1 Tax=Streptomyces TaxID=1883 RepID=UPI0004A8E1C5|nr:hypothetical protein [Streptomyces sp. NTK 937]KDQ68288.1 hypothetical protein DT87_14080 [Streptomyces sp. NTK 937]
MTDQGPATGSGSTTGSHSAGENPLAGRSAGEGRVRPGRTSAPSEVAPTDTPVDEVPPEADPGDTDTGEADPGVVPAFTPPPEAFPEPGHTARQRQALVRLDTHQVKQTLLGTGIILVGLGTGFLGLRMRRTR